MRRKQPVFTLAMTICLESPWIFRPQNPSGIAKVKNAINMAVQVNRNAIE
jgi:hypothetical protein